MFIERACGERKVPRSPAVGMGVVIGPLMILYEGINKKAHAGEGSPAPPRVGRPMPPRLACATNHGRTESARTPWRRPPRARH